MPETGSLIRSLAPAVRGTAARLRWPILLILTAWIVETADFLLGRNFEPDQYGIAPRSLRGLAGIFLAPFLHADWGHLLANTVPLLVTGGLVALRGPRAFWRATLWITVISGFCVWLAAGKGEVHIGASSLIFGYAGYLITAGWREKRLLPLAAAGLVIFLYGAGIAQIFPSGPRISWQGHLFGMAAGILAARGGKLSRIPPVERRAA